MLTLQIRNPGNMWVMSCFSQVDLRFLSALVIKCDLVQPDSKQTENEEWQG